MEGESAEHALPWADASLVRGTPPLTYRVRRVHEVEAFSMVVVPPCRFMKGSPGEDADGGDNASAHEVQLTRSFAVGSMLVTQRLWWAVIGTNPSFFKDGAECQRQPVEQVSWLEALRFCNRLSEANRLKPAYTLLDESAAGVTCDLDASGFRLLADDEWACCWKIGGSPDGLAATVGRTHGEAASRDAPLMWYQSSGSSRMSTLVAWYGEGVYRDDDGVVPSVVDAHSPDAAGLHQVGTNVAEWCWGSGRPCVMGAPTALHRVRSDREGHFGGKNNFLKRNASDGSRYIGFRLARTVS